jgi:hypothetical protein
MQTVVETPTFLNAAETILNEPEIREIIDTVVADPEFGDVMTGTAASGSFGSPVKEWERAEALVSFTSTRTNATPVFLITVFPKNKRANLIKAERNAFKKRANSIFANYRS